MLQLLNQLYLIGFTATQILNFVGRKFNNLQKGIQNAQGNGIPDEKILQFISGKWSKGREAAAERDVSANDKYLSGLGFKTRAEKEAQQGRFLKGALGLAGTAAAGYGLYRGMQPPAAIRGQVLPALPQQGAPGLPGPTAGPAPQIGPVGGGIGAVNVPGKQGQAVPPQNVVQPPQSVMPAPGNQPLSRGMVATPKFNPGGVLDEMNLRERVENMASAGNPPLTIAAAISQQLSQGQKKWLKEEGIDLDKIVIQHLASQPQAPNVPRGTSQPSEPSGSSTGVPAMTSATEMPSLPVAGAQAAPSQISPANPLEPTGTNRTISPETLTGPKTTSGPFTLGSIDTSSNRRIHQSTDNVDEIYSKLKSIEPKFKQQLTDITKESNGITLKGPRLKLRETVEKKIQSKGGGAHTIGDYLGGRLVFDKPEDLRIIRNRIEPQAYEVDDFLDNPKKGMGYRAIHYQVDLGNGTSAEVQAVPKDIMDVFPQAHDIYDKWKRENIGPEDNLETRAKFAFDQAKVSKLFDSAWAKYQSKLKASEEGTRGKIAKMAMLPDGRVGETTWSGKGLVKVNVDGKTVLKRESDIVQEPKEIADLNIDHLVDAIAQKFPEGAGSSNLSLVMFQPGLGLTVRYHSGSTGYYAGVPREEYERLIKAEGVPVTSGETRGGKWQAGVGDSRGRVAFEIKNAKDANGQPLYPWIPVAPEDIHFHPVLEATGKSLGKKASREKAKAKAQSGSQGRDNKAGVSSEEARIRKQKAKV